MNEGRWGNPKRIWGLEPYYDLGRVIEIYEAVKDLDIHSALDVACGVGFILEGLSWVIEADYEQFDIQEYPEWDSLKVKPQKMDLFDFIKEDNPFDLVLFLNAYRNWNDEDRNAFDRWLKRNAKYFITSNPSENGPSENWSVIGRDVKGYDLKLYEI